MSPFVVTGYIITRTGAPHGTQALDRKVDHTSRSIRIFTGFHTIVLLYHILDDIRSLVADLFGRE